MLSISKAKLVKDGDKINQGDIFKNVKYSYIDAEDDESVEILEYTFPYAVIVSQSCDVAFMDDFFDNEKKSPVKFMPSILMCPIYHKELIKHGEHLKDVFEDMNIKMDTGAPYYNKDDIKVTEKDQHVRFHSIKVVVNDSDLVIDNSVIDFKHIFSVPMKYLRLNRQNRICSLDDIYIDQIVNKMTAYIARIGLPDPKIPQ